MKELPLGDTIDAFNKDEGDMDIVAHLGVDSKKNRKVKEEVLIVAEFIAKFKQKMKEEITTMAEEYAMKMATIQEELRTSNTHTDAILAMLSRLTSSTQVPRPTI